jgi:hypothetical protein
MQREKEEKTQEDNMGYLQRRDEAASAEDGRCSGGKISWEDLRASLGGNVRIP